MSRVLPVNPSVASASVGKDYLLYVNGGTAAVPVWVLIGGQRSASLSRSADEIDVSHKTSGGWKAVKAGLRKWSIDLGSLVILSDDGLAILETAFMAGAEVNTKLLYPDGSYQTGWGSLTDFSTDTPYDGEATLKGTIGGNGPISDRTPSIDPLSATVSKAAAVDKVFNILPATTTVASVSNGATALTTTNQYMYVSGTLTLKGTYISTLAVGIVTITVVTGDGASIPIALTITA